MQTSLIFILNCENLSRNNEFPGNGAYDADQTI